MQYLEANPVLKLVGGDLGDLARDGIGIVERTIVDLAQVALCPGLVLHDRGAADHLLVCDLLQVGQDLILHAIGEEGVFRIGTKVFIR